MLLFPKYIKNPGNPLLHAPAIWIEHDTIAFVGPRSELPQPACSDENAYELPEVCLFPGLVNAHCHLELSFAKDLKYPGDFVDWIRSIIRTKNESETDVQYHGLSQGTFFSLLGGTTCLGDHVSFNGPIDKIIQSPFRGRLFIEVLGVVPEVANDILAAAMDLEKVFSKASERFTLHPSPHSIHALAIDTLEDLLQQEHALFSIHLGESQAEANYFSEKSGSLYDLICERGSEQKHNENSGIQELSTRGQLNGRILAIHGNYFTEAELTLCAQHEISIVHCPLSHQYFSHRPFPIQAALDRNINLALGTDSLASASSLSMLEVLRQTEVNFPTLSREAIFAIATTGGAKALKLENEVGEIAVGKKADFIGISMENSENPLGSLFQAEQVNFSMIDGRMLIG